MAVRTLLLCFGFAIAAPAQWINQRTLGLPRDGQGRFNAAAPAPLTAAGKPDFSGLWSFSPGLAYSANVTASLATADIQPAARTLSRRRLEDFGKDDPETVGCTPGGPRHILGSTGGLVKIFQSPQAIAVLYEDLSFRQIFLDGRALPQDPNPAWMGYSVGHWDGETLIVESAGFDDRSWLDFAGHPHTEELRITERWRRTAYGHIDREVALEDPALYARPIRVAAHGNIVPDTELIETICDNEKDRAHLLGRTSQEKAVAVPESTLARYTGSYETSAATAFNPRGGSVVFTVSLDDGQLYLDFQGNGKVPMIPLSQNTFSPRLLGTFEFVSNSNGQVTHMFIHSAEEVLRANRTR